MSARHRAPPAAKPRPGEAKRCQRLQTTRRAVIVAHCWPVHTHHLHDPPPQVRRTGRTATSGGACCPHTPPVTGAGLLLNAHPAAHGSTHFPIRGQLHSRPPPSTTRASIHFIYRQCISARSSWFRRMPVSAVASSRRGRVWGPGHRNGAAHEACYGDVGDVGVRTPTARHRLSFSVSGCSAASIKLATAGPRGRQRCRAASVV
jgi:hypothetical protein